MGNKIEKRESSVLLKKAISLFLSLVILFSITAGLNISVYAAASEEEWTYFNLDNGTIEITGYYGTDTKVIIPSKIDGYLVTSIHESTFYGNKYLTSVVIPDSVITIGNHAFYNCTNLSIINIPDSVISIGSWAFDNTCYYDDTSNWIDDSLYIGNHLIKVNDCISGDYFIRNGTVSIADDAIQYCHHITSITIPDSVKGIGVTPFLVCQNLSSIFVSESNENYSADNGVLYNKSKTELIKYPSEKIDTSYSIPVSVKKIWDAAFAYNFYLTNVMIPYGVVSIGSEAFFNCSNLECFTIPDSVQSIGGYAFSNTSYWENENNWEDGILYNGNHLIDSDNTFRAEICSVKNGTLTIADYAFCGFTLLEEIIFPDSLLYIGRYSFSECGMLYSVTIPKNVQIIGERAFIYCSRLASITILNRETKIDDDSNTIPIGTTINSYCNSEAVIYAKSHGNKFVSLDGQHIFDSGIITQSRTCSEDGVKTYTCAGCGETRTETIPATGHSYDNGKVTKAATVAATGIKTYTCTVCGSTKTEIIPATGLTAPTLKAIVNSDGSFTLDWNKIVDADVYELYLQNADGTYKLLKSTAATSLTTAVAAYGKTYTYKVRALSSDIYASDYSATVNVINDKKLQTPTMKATVNTTGTFKLSWNAIAGATSYEVYLKNADGSYKLLKTTTATSLTTAVATYGKSYTYKVRAITSKNSSATSAYSATVTATNTKKLQTPTLKVTVNSTGSFKLSWNKITGATSYKVYLKNANGTYKLLKTTTGTSITTGVAAYGKSYTYKVLAVKGSVTSAYSATVTAKNSKKLQTPSGVKAVTNKNGSFTISWNKVTGATSYQVYVLDSKTNKYKLLKTTTSNKVTTGIAAKGKTYKYKVRAVTSKNSSATSAYSSVVSKKR